MKEQGKRNVNKEYKKGSREEKVHSILRKEWSCKSVESGRVISIEFKKLFSNFCLGRQFLMKKRQLINTGCILNI